MCAMKCAGCKREFEKTSSLNSHKRFCKEWIKVRHSYIVLHSSQEEVKNTPASCPLCNLQFKNVYSMSAHKTHCANPNFDPFANSRGWSKGKILIPLEDLFKKDSSYSTGYAKNAIVTLGLRKNECECCKLSSWQGAKITLELDHINGIRNDHRLENLRLLCPNCHSQTPNWRGRNKNTGQKKISDEDFILLLSENCNRQALMKAGLAPSGGNYKKCEKLRVKS
jgi:hypothetical protein